MVWDGGWEENRLDVQIPKSKVAAGLVKGRSLLSLEKEKIDQFSGQIFSFLFSFFLFLFFSFFFFLEEGWGNKDRKVGVNNEKGIVSLVQTSGLPWNVCFDFKSAHHNLLIYEYKGWWHHYSAFYLEVVESLGLEEATAYPPVQFL